MRKNKICLFYERLILAPPSPILWPSRSMDLRPIRAAVTCPRFILCSLKINYRRLFGLSVRCHLFLGFTTFVNILSKFPAAAPLPRGPQIAADFAQIFCEISFDFRFSVVVFVDFWLFSRGIFGILLTRQKHEKYQQWQPIDTATA